MKKNSYTNNLISESSPYLLQHAHNPVNWHSYSLEILTQAKKEKKLIIISIGYSTCHWCHVMEHESFEDEAVAKVMNDHFISIKVDREERPDVDQVYMNAVQLMTGTGGWPLNVVALPDGRPIWGGTYFRKEQWIDALSQIQKLYLTQPKKLIDYANRLKKGIKSMDLIVKNKSNIDFKNFPLKEVVENLVSDFDTKNGGFGQAPKFMMPNLLEFILRYAHQEKQKELMDFVFLTLNKIAFGGIYDQISGGFSRYSVDEKWHIPHFEKMLYDNALLISLYSNAFSISKNKLYQEIIEETISFVQKELTHQNGMFFSALDADSNDKNGILKEGAFYSFTAEELQKIVKSDFEIFKEYYNINEFGRWENNEYVLIRRKTDEEIANKFHISTKVLYDKKQNWKTLLSDLKNKRSRPRLDDKTLTSWNALMIKSLLDAYRALNEKKYLDSALKSAELLIEKQLQKDNSLFHVYKDEKSTIHGFLEDYAFIIDMAIGLYEVTFDWKWINLAENLTEYSICHFMNDEDGMFYFISKENISVIHRSKEYYDNVIPSSNSVMAKNLFRLSKFLNKSNYEKIAEQMLKNVLDQLKNHPRGFGNWLDLLMNLRYNFNEIILAGEDISSMSKEIYSLFLPNKIIAGIKEPDEKPIFKNRFQDGKNLIYICQNNACQKPFNSIKNILKIIT